jgi:hypothetical protein
MRGVRRATWPSAAALTVVCATASAADRTGTNAVDLVLVGPDAQVSPMRAVSEELLARLGVAATVTFAAEVDPADVVNPRPGAEPRVARAWIDLSHPDRVTLYLVDRDWERVLVRHLPRMQGHDELAREAVGHVLETAVDALLHGARIGVVRDDAQRELEVPPSSTPPAVSSKAPLPGPAPPAERFGRLRLEGGAGYEAALYASGGVVTQGPEAMLLVSTGGGPLRPALWLTAQYRIPLRIDAHPLGVRLEGAAARALAAVDATVSRRVSLRLGAGAGVDVLHMSPLLESGSHASAAGDQSFAVIVGRASLGLRFSLAPHVSMASTLSCDLGFGDGRYVTIVNGAATAALSPWTVRPALSLAVEAN